MTATAVVGAMTIIAYLVVQIFSSNEAPTTMALLAKQRKHPKPHIKQVVDVLAFFNLAHGTLAGDLVWETMHMSTWRRRDGQSLKDLVEAHNYRWPVALSLSAFQE